MVQYQQAVRVAPRFLPARSELAAAQLARGDFHEAIGQWEAMLQLKPDCAEAMTGLADLLATCSDARFRDGPAAMELARQAD